MPGTNTLAYFEKSELTTVKSFITFAPGRRRRNRKADAVEARIVDEPVVLGEVSGDADHRRRFVRVGLASTLQDLFSTVEDAVDKVS